MDHKKNIKGHIEASQNSMDAIAQQIKLLKKMAKKPPASDNISISSSYFGVLIKIRKIEHLTEAREYLRSVFGEWHDEIKNIWESCGSGLVEYKYSFKRKSKDPNIKRIEIRLDVPIEKFPEELTKGGKCGFVKTTRDDYNFVCKQ